MTFPILLSKVFVILMILGNVPKHMVFPSYVVKEPIGGKDMEYSRELGGDR